MTCASQRLLFGRTNANRPSRFLGEIPPELLEQSGRTLHRAEDPASQERPAEGGFRRRTPVKRTYDRGYSMGGSFSGGTPDPQPAPDWKSPAAGPAGAADGSQGFRKGDTVRHKAFGKGLVTGLTPMGGDALIEIAFDGVGTKRLMLKSAARFLNREE